MSKSNEVLGGYQAMERRNLQKTNAEFTSPEVTRSFPPPNHRLEASAAGESTTASSETVMSQQANGGSMQLGTQAKGVAQQKWQPPKDYGSSTNNAWETDHTSDGKGIRYYNRQDAQNRATFLMAAGEWEVALVMEEKGIYYVKKKGRRTVSNFIRLVQKLEAAYPKASSAEITEMLRAIGNYNDAYWQAFMGKKAKVPEVKPIGQVLTKADLDLLRAMLSHEGGDTAATEQGVAKDNLGRMVCMGHVITGMAAGYNPVPKADPRDAFGLGSIPIKALGIGTTLDNLYAVTISGDLGQSAVLKDRAGSNEETNYLGDHSDATAAELIGDVDGFNLGDMLQRGVGKGMKVSDVLTAYYAYTGKNSRNRWTNFQHRAKHLKGETIKFAQNYKYTGPLLDKPKNGSAYVDDDARRATDQFMGIVQDQAYHQETHSIQDKLQKHMFIRTQGQDLAYLSADANNYQGTKIASLANGIKVCPINPGDAQFFNRGLAHREVYGFTYCMVLTGGFEGQFGWVSNSFLRPN